VPTDLERLIIIRSQLVEEVNSYLNDLAKRMADLPAYYPRHLREHEAGETRFDEIRQKVRVVEDRDAHERMFAQMRERAQAAGKSIDLIAYFPARSQHDHCEDRIGSTTVVWDRRLSERSVRTVVLGDPGFGKTWLLRYEARRLAIECIKGLRERTATLNSLTLPIYTRMSDLNRSDGSLGVAVLDIACSGRSAEFREFMDEKLRTDRCVVLMDGWDEVPEERPLEGRSISYQPRHRQRLKQRLEDFVNDYRETRILLTSRIVGYVSCPLPKAQEIELVAFDQPQIESFVRVWFRDDAHGQKFLEKLRQNPQVKGLAEDPNDAGAHVPELLGRAEAVPDASGRLL
jgi:predicted NACHT family NTPase